MHTHDFRPVPHASPRSVNLGPQDSDADFPAYSKRMAHAISMAIPALLAQCEWSGAIYNHGWQQYMPPPDWRSREPIAYIRNGTEAPIVTLALYSRSTGAMEPIWTAKIFEDHAALEMLTWFTRANAWMQ
jgi:hypothetical protein